MKESEAANCRQKSVTPVEFLVGTDVITVIVNKENTFLKDVTRDELAKIFSDRVRRWSEVRTGWPNQEILRYSPQKGRGTLAYFKEAVMAPAFNWDRMAAEKAFSRADNLQYFHDYDLLAKSVAENPNGIGFLGYYYYQGNRELVRGISVDGILPGLETAQSGEYPLTRPLYVYADANVLLEESQVAAFLNYLIVHAGEQAEKLGLIPASDEMINRDGAVWMEVVGTHQGESLLPPVNPATLKGDIEIDGSSTVYPLIRAIADRFVAEGFGKTYLEEEYEGSEKLLSRAKVGAGIIADPRAVQAITGLNWQVVVSQDGAEALMPVRAQMRTLLFVIIVIVSLLAGGAVLIARSMSVPIVRLTDVAERVAGGDLSARAEVSTRDEIGTLATTFNTMTAELQETLEGLEQRVADRTHAIEVSADVSRRLSTILDPAVLAVEVVELLQSAFDFYHVHIYLFDEDRENLIMVGGTGEAGKKMLTQGHSISSDKGIVGRACKTGTVVLVQDTYQDPSWLPNPLLPETRSEVAVPIIFGDDIMGALDVQQNEIWGISQQYVDLLVSIANQVAIALNNARQFERAQKTAKRQASMNEVVHQIQSTQTIESALQVAVREVGRIFNVDLAQVDLTTRDVNNGNE